VVGDHFPPESVGKLDAVLKLSLYPKPSTVAILTDSRVDGGSPDVHH
jgi:hypothetical protein